ncbi:hypothetical protein ZWY2020_037485 [Hordeum vulgare]|nr:hypothetical protein ZWY2020_037485 [Hordeum vulgare]
MAVVLLRKLLSPTSSFDSSAAAPPPLWPVLSPDGQAAHKAHLLAALRPAPARGGRGDGGGDVDEAGAVAGEGRAVPKRDGVPGQRGVGGGEYSSSSWSATRREEEARGAGER